MHAYFDSHIHLSDKGYSDILGYVVPNLERLDIAACAVSMDHLDSARTLEMSKMSRHILPFVGIHPERIYEDDVNDALYGLVSLAEQNKERICGIGEIGLDPTYVDDGGGGDDGRVPTRQVRAFEDMLELAARLDKPVSIHSRKSLDQIFDVMTSFDARRASLHWFDGGKRQLARAQDMGFYISYGPVSVYANDKQKLIVLSEIDKLLVETDGPVRFSRCFGYKIGQACFVASVINTIAEVHQMTFDFAASLIAKNSAEYLGL